jgi:23S rRNA (adenine2503-C2)-methyltransferase
VNDTDDDAARLAALLDSLDAQVNLIPHNAFHGSALRPPADDDVRRFQKALSSGGVKSIVRWPRGRDIAAACGQLAGRNPLVAAEV